MEGTSTWSERKVRRKAFGGRLGTERKEEK